MANVWDDVLPEEDRLVFERAGWGREVGFGEKPVLLVVDVIYNFIGDRPEPILESIKKWRYSCGERGWVGGFIPNGRSGEEFVVAIERVLAIGSHRHGRQTTGVATDREDVGLLRPKIDIKEQFTGGQHVLLEIVQ